MSIRKDLSTVSKPMLRRFCLLLSYSGWGATGVTDTSTDKLQETLVPIVPSSTCLERMNLTEAVSEDLIICAGGAGAGPCKVWAKFFFFRSLLFLIQGDSGGPLTVAKEKGAHVLAGIVSRRLGESCSEEDYAVYTSISQFLPWIESSIKENGGMASCGFNISAAPKLGVSQEPSSPPGLLVLGGQTKEGPIASVETFGFENCTIPPLPETRYGFGSFLTPTEPPQLAVCGGSVGVRKDPKP